MCDLRFLSNFTTKLIVQFVFNDEEIISPRNQPKLHVYVISVFYDILRKMDILKSI